MEYPLISEYKEAILSPEDKINELASHRPMLDSSGKLVISSEQYATEVSEKDLEEGVKDEFGVIYSRDGKRLIRRVDATVDFQSMLSYNVKDGTQVICDNAFWGNHFSLEKVTLPNSVRAIGKAAFWGCSKLQSINIPDSVAFIGSSAFYGCDRLQSVNIPDLITHIDDEVFCGCYNLQSVIIPN